MTYKAEFVEGPENIRVTAPCGCVWEVNDNFERPVGVLTPCGSDKCGFQWHLAGAAMDKLLLPEGK